MKLTPNDITPELNAIIALATELTEETDLDPKILLKAAVAKLDLDKEEN